MSRLFLRGALCVLAFCACTGSEPAPGGPGAHTDPSAHTAPGVSVNTESKPETSMQRPIMPYPWMRGGASILVGRLANVRVEPGAPGEQITRMDVRIEESIWGPRGAEVRKADVSEPAALTGRMKYPHPIWGGVPLQNGTRVIVATAELGEALDKPLFVAVADDAALAEVRDIAAAESAPQDGAARRRRYLDWLAGGSPPKRLFAAEALEKDKLPDIDPEGEAAATFARIFEGEKDIFMKMFVAERMWSGIYRRTNAKGKVAIINALLRHASHPSQLLRTFCLDRLSEVEPADLEAPGVIQVPEARPFLTDRLAEETDAAARARLKKVMEKALP